MRIETEVDPAKLEEWMANRLRDMYNWEFNWEVEDPLEDNQTDLVKAIKIVHNEVVGVFGDTL
jgi:hypothetical protein